MGHIDFLGTDLGITSPVSSDFDNLLQFPLFGQAMVVAYNLPIAASDTFLVLDRSTLGAIWAGAITTWDDQRIKDLNPPAVAAILPAANIALGYTSSNQVSFAQVFKVAMSSFSDTFRTALAAANDSFARMPPALAGHAFEAVRQNTTYGMTFVRQAMSVAAGLSWANMVNKAGKTVEPSVSTVQAAMSQFARNFSAGDLTIDIVDAPGDESWPLSYHTFLAFNRSVTALDCTNIQELTRFIAWALTNEEASTLAITSGGVPIDVSLRKYIIDRFNDFECNGEKVASTSYLIGTGPPLPLYSAWTVAFSTAQATFKYFSSTSLQAKEQLIAFGEQFGTTSTGLEARWYEAIDDVALLPATIYAVVPGYNLRELSGLELFGPREITMWDDARIKALNTPEVAAALPAQAIHVVVQSVETAITQLFTTMLSAVMPKFAVQVGAGPLVTSPVQSYNTTTAVNSNDALPRVLADTDYGFAFVTLYDATLFRVLQHANLRRSDGVIVRANQTSIQNAVKHYFAENPNPDYGEIILSGGSDSWPLATFGSFIYHNRRMQDCAKSRALASFFSWTQTSTESQHIAQRQGFILASSDKSLQRRMLNQLQNFTCGGVAVSELYGCINDGELCSGAGVCANNAGREGQYCESVASSSSDRSVTVILATIFPVGLVVLGVGACLAVMIIALARCKKKKSDDWEISYDELEVGRQLGAGGFGVIHKAVWKGTEVAVKVMASAKVTKDMKKDFHDEVRVMTSLRHPNVVLFMAACTRPPKMCIVMEYMALGSLYDLLHNDLIAEIPFNLKAKMGYHAARGMHFLHSSGIVHRDLTSLNLLLDHKWNVKVSDFGLTKFKEDVRQGGKYKDNAIVGSLHWTAPEVLNESVSAGQDFLLADVYSFGIILWELLSREQPYAGMSPVAVAVAVMRDGIRPQMPATPGLCPLEFAELITSCWHADPTVRPTFLEIMTRLAAMHTGADLSSGVTTSLTSKTSTTSSFSSVPPGVLTSARSRDTSWSLPSTNDSSASVSASSASKDLVSTQMATGGGTVRPPRGDIAVVFTDITRAASLWEFNAWAMRDATLLHNETLRAVLKRQNRGYEVVFAGDRSGCSGEGSFCMAFQHASDALAWCCGAQLALLGVAWPEELLAHPGAAEEWGDTDDRVVHKGLRVRMGVDFGPVRVVRDPTTGRVEYRGPVVDTAARITTMAHGGQIIMSLAACEQLHDTPVAAAGPATSPLHEAPGTSAQGPVVGLGRFAVPDVSPGGLTLYEMKIAGLEGRFFGGVADQDVEGDGDESDAGDGEFYLSRSAFYDDSDHRGRMPSLGGGSKVVQTVLGEGTQHHEDLFLASANLCRWIIDYGEIQVGEQVGLGSYGLVHRGRWRGVEVAVKRFITQKLDERRMLEFRAEMAFLSELHHPNIVLFIGACVKRPNLCIVTEFVQRGSLRDLLANTAVKLTWRLKLRLLRSAALGVHYLHALQPVIVHRDLKPSNLLVDESWNVKVADFGFARIKEENATMTRCGTPCWTAPEVIRGDKYDERADVFSFGVVMWQVLTRREPYAGRNFMNVSLDVLEGKRPQLPADCPAELRKVMKKCWHAAADRRPTMERVLAFLDQELAGKGEDGDSMFSSGRSLV
ncbi:serine/threonine protein kinase [Acanthamoeba castellanii str. Neff]|uniref:non-specific serine/threonine protein kinase n=1 Tax=Acanthamoeba castellanii (strain ATCC 30010 / Neff) TaxID=1257118 RepID=L8HIJ1_ACACF|nr:serine/threonine protein kinase [Acanthamoeba castellanii str. Neff]ELR24201.1 serine/threonine protein kinase [Acanthamoeba castellanii str. Neff]